MASEITADNAAGFMDQLTPVRPSLHDYQNEQLLGFDVARHIDTAESHLRDHHRSSPPERTRALVSRPKRRMFYHKSVLATTRILERELAVRQARSRHHQTVVRFPK